MIFKRVINLLGCVLLISCKIAAQKPAVSSGARVDVIASQYKNAASLQVQAPIGDFASSHLIGVQANYEWTKRRFGKYINVSPAIGWHLSGSAEWTRGKQVKTANYNFRFNDYWYFNPAVGAIYYPKPNVNLILSAGPAVSIYAGNPELSLGINFNGNYILNNQYSIGPVFNFRQASKAEALLSAGVKVSRFF